MNNSKLPVYMLGRGSGLPKRSDPIFRPSPDGQLLHSQYEHRTADGVVRVGSEGADFPYMFHGVQSELELVHAFLYILYKDNATHGTYTKAAKNGLYVYTHSMQERVERWWALPDDLKYRGYRLDL